MANEKTVDINDFKREARKRKAKETVDKYIVDPAKKVCEYAVNNPMVAIAAIGTLIPVANKAMRLRQTKLEDRRRDVDFYDTRSGRHVISRRPLNKSEQMEVDRRFKSGESYTSILYDMKLLK